MIRYDQRTETAPATVAELIRSLDWILGRLVRLREAFPARARELAPRINSALDERLRLMRLRDGTLPIPTKHTQSHR